MTKRLEAFVEPFVAALNETAQQQQRRRHFVESASGLLSNLERKTGEGIAYLHGQDRQPMPQFVGESPWEHAPLLTELARQVGARIGAADGVIVFAPLSVRSKTSLREAGDEVGGCRAAVERTAGQDRQLSGGIDMAYVSRREHALVNVRRYLPQEWTKHRARCRAAGVPDDVKFQTRHAQAREMPR